MSLRLPLLLAMFFALVVIGTTVAGASRGLIARATWFEDPQQESGTVVPGGYAVQQRGYFSMTAQMHLKALTPGHRYTLWWVIYNNPSLCAEGCDFNDVTTAVETGANPAGIGVHFGGSFLVASTGKLDVGTRLLENAVGGCQTSVPYVALCEELIDAAIAEATILVHDHGPIAPTDPMVAAEAFASGCKNYKRLDTVVATYAATGYECFSPQTVYLP